MFEAAELGRKVSKEDYKEQLPGLRAQLLEIQFALSQTDIPVIILVSGVNAAGRGEVVNALNEWLDTRGVEVFSFDSLTDEEAERPNYWRFWRVLPARGRIGILFGAWYRDPIDNLATGKIDAATMDKALDEIRRFEHMLVQDGALIIKLWLHLSREQQIKRLKKLEKDPDTLRRVLDKDWDYVHHYEELAQAGERAIRHTDSGEAPWLLVESTDTRYRDLTVGHTVLEALRKRIETFNQEKTESAAGKHKQTEQSVELPPVSAASPKAAITILDHVDLNQKIEEAKEYRQALKTYQGRLHRLAWQAHEKKRSCIVMFEGWDAAGKGGCIRRMTQAMDARLYRVISTAAPTDEERAHHYLWRFWRHIPRAGYFTFYDRSWYGRVLVERVEGFARENEWRRAYLEINNFEEMLVNHGIVVVKFWLHISAEEQLRRFEERQVVPYKQHKITEEDWRNRDKWDPYRYAVNDMVARTSTHFAPWNLIAGDDKRFARVDVLKTVCERLEAVL
jgi:polyphosphate:AMP phosphotransferase